MRNVWCQFWLIFPKSRPLASAQRAFYAIRLYDRKINCLYTFSLVGGRGKKKVTENLVYRALTLPRIEIYSFRSNFHAFFLAKHLFILFSFRPNRCPVSQSKWCMFNVIIIYFVSDMRWQWEKVSSIQQEKFKRRLMIVLIVNYVKENPFNHFDNGIKIILLTILMALCGVTGYKMTQ